MDAGMVKLAAAGILAAHGLGHSLGWLPALGLASFEGVSTRSWLFSGMVGDTAVRVAAGVLFLVPMAGFAVAAGGILLGQPWWRPVAAGSAAVSLLATALYPSAFTPASTIGSVAVDLAVLYGVLVAGWGAESAVG